MHSAGNTFDNIAHKLIDEQMASDINHLLELVEAGTIATLKHIDRKDNPHEVTKEQVGLGNVDNTSDADKPISNATQSALNTLTNNTNNMINQVNENIGIIVGQLNNNIGVITGELNKQILGTQSAIETFKEENKTEHDKINSAINTVKVETASAIFTLSANIGSAINTFREENRVEHGKINSAINTLKVDTASAIKTFKEENKAEHNKINSAINTLKVDTASAINTLKEENKAEHNKINSAINTFKEENKAEHNKINSAINTFKEENKAEHNKINSAINTFKEENKAEHNKINSAISTLKVDTISAINTLKEELDFSAKPKISITAVNTFGISDADGTIKQMDKSEFYRLPEINVTTLDALTVEGNYLLFVEYGTDLANKLDSLIGYGFTGIQGAFKLEVSRGFSGGAYDYMQKLTTTIPTMPFVFFRTRTPERTDAFTDTLIPAKWSDWQKATSNMMTVANAGTVSQAVNVLSYTAQGNPVTVPFKDMIVGLTPLPIGFIYFQLRGQSTPDVLFGTSGKWQDISSTYAGEFFRAVGGDAASFGGKQNEGLPNIVGTSEGVETSKVRGNVGCFEVAENGAGKLNMSNASGINYRITFSAKRSNSIYGTSAHVTPYNSSIRIWKKIS